MLYRSIITFNFSPLLSTHERAKSESESMLPGFEVDISLVVAEMRKFMQGYHASWYLLLKVITVLVRAKQRGKIKRQVSRYSVLLLVYWKASATKASNMWLLNLTSSGSEKSDMRS